MRGFFRWPELVLHSHFGIAAFLSLLLLGPLPCSSQGPPNYEPVPGSYSIHGTLRSAADDRGVSMVRVDLRHPTSELISSTYTDSNGDFHFYNLVKGNYVVTVEEEGYEPVRETVELKISYRSGVLLYLKKPGQLARAETGNTVSVRELNMPRRARDAFRKGMEQLYDKKSPQACLAHFQHAIAEFPGYYEAYYQLGVAYLDLGRTDEAQQAFQKSIEASEKHFAQSFFALGSILTKQQKYAQAEESIRRGLELDATAWQGHYELARLLFSQNRVDEAEQSAEQARTQKPDFAPTYLLLADICIRKRDYSTLLKNLEEYLRLEPNGTLSEKARAMRDQLQRARAQSQTTPAANPTKP